MRWVCEPADRQTPPCENFASYIIFHYKAEHEVKEDEKRKHGMAVS